MPVVMSKGVTATSLGTGTADIQLGAAEQKAPEWTKWFLGFSTGGVIVTPTSTQACHAQAYVSSNDFTPNPSVVLVPIAQGAVATNSASESIELEYWPCNFPIHGGDGYSIYMGAEVANTAAPYGIAEATFADADGRVSSRLDPYPGVTQYHNAAGFAALATTNQAFAAFTLTGTDSLIELEGYVVAPTIATAARPEIGKFRFTSNGFFSSPIELVANTTNGYLGTVTGAIPFPRVTRKDCLMPCAPTTIISASYLQENATAVTTSVANCGVAFTRRP